MNRFMKMLGLGLLGMSSACGVKEDPQEPQKPPEYIISQKVIREIHRCIDHSLGSNMEDSFVSFDELDRECARYNPEDRMSKEVSDIAFDVVQDIKLFLATPVKRWSSEDRVKQFEYTGVIPLEQYLSEPPKNKNKKTDYLLIPYVSNRVKTGILHLKRYEHPHAEMLAKMLEGLSYLTLESFMISEKTRDASGNVIKYETFFDKGGMSWWWIVRHFPAQDAVLYEKAAKRYDYDPRNFAHDRYLASVLEGMGYR